ncbi:MAG: site-specific integrase [Alphaproteobacteria bacterium]|nr:site-specific integrase [Alphaproteobacteria bacterium]
MSNRYQGLFLLYGQFYIRVRIPLKLQNIARCKEIRYSLRTANYSEAVQRWQVEFAHLHLFLTLFQDIIMKLNEQNKLILNEADVDKLLLERLTEIQHFLEENIEEIRAGTKSEKDIINKTVQTKKLMIDLLIRYLKRLVDDSKANITLRGIYAQLREKEIELGLSENAQYDVVKSFSNHIKGLNNYATKAVEAIKLDKPYIPSNPKVVTLLKAYDAMETSARINRSMTSTHWEKLFKRFAQSKKNLKGVTDNRINDNYLSIKLAFALMKLQYVEDVTKQHCRKLCEDIYQVPKKWSKKLKDNVKIEDILTTAKTKVISKKTVKGYLITFKEFMRYAVKEEIILTSLNEFIDLPKDLSGTTREPFTVDDLHKIFNPKTYPDPHAKANQAKFWIPIISLYHGSRLNEICQLDVLDIVKEQGIPCISINDNGNDKSVKNRGSKRVIPIHPKLLQMGFLYFVEYQRQEKQTKLFGNCVKQSRNGFGGPIQHWFGRYLDSIGIKSKTKVFHSFRHTWETKAVEKRIPAEYQNAICGWTDQGIGQRLYAHKKDIRIMLSELKKINYPIQKEMSKLHMSFMDSYVIRQLRAKG